MNPAKIVMHVVKRNRPKVVLNLGPHLLALLPPVITLALSIDYWLMRPPPSLLIAVAGFVMAKGTEAP